MARPRASTASRPWAVAVGAGPEQLPWIARAGAMGHPVLALDADDRAAGRAHAAASATVDLLDPDAVLAAIGDRVDAGQVGFVLPAPMGRIIATVGVVNHVLGLPGIGPATARASADKAAFDATARAAGARRPVQRVTPAEPAGLRAAIDEVGLPCVVKPRSGSGSRGVRALRDRQAVEDLLVAARAGPPDPLVVEEWVEGPEVGVDLVVVDGTRHTLLVRDKELTDPPARQVVAYAAPGRADPEALDQELDRCVAGLGLDHGVAHADVVLSPSGPVVIEMSARPAGLLIAHHLVGLAVDIDLVALSIELVADPDAARARLATAARPGRGVALRFLPAPAGTVASVPREAELRAQPGIVHAEVWARPGATLAPVSTGADVYQRGVVLAVGPGPEEAAAAARAAVARAPIRVEA